MIKDDVISRQAVIEKLFNEAPDQEGVDDVIELINEIPSVKSEDAISRKAVNALYDKWRPRLATHISDFGDELKLLPSVQPSRKGHWITTDYIKFECSECGCLSNYDSRFCKDCGADMGMEEERADMRGDTDAVN